MIYILRTINSVLPFVPAVRLLGEKKQVGTIGVTLVDSLIVKTLQWVEEKKRNSNPKREQIQFLMDKVLSAANRELLLLRISRTIDLYLDNPK